MEHDAKQISVKDIMTKSIITVDAATTVADVAKMMEDTKVGAY
jgi:CBS domain-containing protein